MKPNIFIRFSSFLRRDLIKKDEGKLTYVQLFGFVLIILGIIYFASFLLPSGIIDILPFLKLDEHPESSEVPIAFFTIMLGIAFAFPDMLKGQTKEISTMRIIVFMFANAICMLILKIGWDKHSLGEIGLDGYWMGVIAFLFGAKATQSYFENAKSLLPSNQQPSKSNEQIQISKIAIAQIAKVQNENKLQTLFPNIISVSDTLLDGESCLTLYLEDNNQKNIPEYVTAEINETTNIEVKTEIISNSPAATTHIGQATDELSDSINPDGFASFCVLLTNLDNPDLKFLATAGHNFTKGNFKSMGGFIYNDEQRNVLINGKIKGSLFYQRLHFAQDLAIVRLNETENLFDNYISFKKGYKELSIADVKTKVPNVTIASRKNENRIGSNIREAFVIDINIPFDIMYNGEKRRFQNVILLGSTNERDKSKEVSMRGDSGSCVYCSHTKRLIGILIGGNGKFSFVLPLKDVLETNNFKLI
jgi:hypothetical protein